jgi:CelD/BcsL family acetyltransferase involved in cellulose biosynthesis
MIGTRDRATDSPVTAPAGRLGFQPASLAAGETLADEWSALLATGVTENPFLSPQWCLGCADALPSSERPLVLVARDGGGRLAAIMPALLRSRTTPIGRIGEFAFLPEATSADHVDVIARPDCAEPAAEALSDFIAGEARITIARFANVRQQSIIASIVRHLAREHGWRVIPHQPTPCPRLILSGTYDEYVATLAKRTRRNVRRDRRLLEDDHGAEIRELGPEESGSGIAWLEAGASACSAVSSRPNSSLSSQPSGAAPPPPPIAPPMTRRGRRCRRARRSSPVPSRRHSTRA